ncbi:cyclin-A2-2-like isoform X1 [Senna tora]|uniref:B-like cyclin n=1 Tax=Senna tora TaxID=362788 RepID=A0A834TWZ4_9FABA|nr:cyclin-A2-2-like isoform X1 [Senna tora]
MNRESTIGAKDEERPVRITRARARALGSLGGIPPASRPSFKPEQRPILGANSKRAASDENKTSLVTDAGLLHKRRAVLTDVTNVSQKSCNKYINGSRIQATGVYMEKNIKLESDVSIEVSSTQEDVKTKLAEDLSKIRMVEARDTSTVEVRFEHKKAPQRCASNGVREPVLAHPMQSLRDSVNELPNPLNKDKDMSFEKEEASDGRGIVNIDSELKDPLVWSLYAPLIYNNIRVAELERRPLADYMDRLQQEITPSMRGVLIDWLIEVSDEYKLVPDTLYRTVNLIDRFLSKRLIQKRRLQLLGVTCMLIASKYEEICAPRVEDFCFITDHTYPREEVLKMETEVLNILHFQLSVPTTKTFLRRYIQASQSSCKVPCAELEFLANYLAELTLVEYSFLTFLPSLIAASAVFLARWTLNQSEHPWNPTLEYYTNYKASDLKTTVLALENLQHNTKSCSLSAIHEKYKQQKFNCVATLSPKSAQSLFQEVLQVARVSESWEWSKFDFLLAADLCNCIAATAPPFSVMMGDRPAWKHNKDDTFSTKSVYHAITKFRIRGESNNFWKWKGHGENPLFPLAKRRGMADMDTCSQSNLA